MPRAPINACLASVLAFSSVLARYGDLIGSTMMCAGDSGILCVDNIEANVDLTLTVGERVVDVTIVYTPGCCWEYDDSRHLPGRWDEMDVYQSINTNTS